MTDHGVENALRAGRQPIRFLVRRARWLDQADVTDPEVPRGPRNRAQISGDMGTHQYDRDVGGLHFRNYQTGHAFIISR